jgi:hypothetical protein
MKKGRLTTSQCVCVYVVLHFEFWKQINIHETWYDDHAIEGRSNIILHILIIIKPINNKDSGLESREYGRRDPSRWPRGTLSAKKLALTSPTSGGSSVGIVRLRTQATKFFINKIDARSSEVEAQLALLILKVPKWCMATCLWKHVAFVKVTPL